MSQSETYVPVTKYGPTRRIVKEAMHNALTAMFGETAEDDNGRWCSLMDDFNSRMVDEIENGSSVPKARKALHADFKNELMDIIREEIEAAIDNIDLPE